MTIYKANRSGLATYLLIGFVVFPALVVIIDVEGAIENPYFFLLSFSPLALISWIYFGTGYKIENEKLFYRSGFLSGDLEIVTITEVVKGKTLWSGLKPALAQKGLIIRFNRYDEIYIAPVDNDDLISDLLKINPEILITD